MINTRVRLMAIYLFGVVAFAQTTPAAAEQPVVLTVDADDNVLYRGNTFDLAKLATDPGPTTSVNTAFLTSVNVGDVRMVNGRPAKGILSYQVLAMPFRANPQPGQPIADVDSGGIFECIWQILSPDGKYIGTLLDRGTNAPNAEHAVTGGAGAFRGVTGLHVWVPIEGAPPQRGASTSEDPANRRIHGGGRARVVFYLYPRFRPNVAMTPGGPAVVHLDGKLISTSNPAQAGETLTLYATGLGPTTPLVNFGQAFPQGTAYPANAPVEVSVNGRPTEVLYAGGYAGAIDGYQVNFRLPAALSSGTAVLQLTAAWIPGPEVRIAVK